MLIAARQHQHQAKLRIPLAQAQHRLCRQRIKAHRAACPKAVCALLDQRAQRTLQQRRQTKHMLRADIPMSRKADRFYARHMSPSCVC
jgi:hypothetical protein